MDEKIIQMIDDMRSGLREKLTEMGSAGEEITIPCHSGERRCLIYRPEGVSGPLPVYFEVHGGGFIYGCPELGDDFAQRIVNEVGCVVIAPSYRLAPENKFPADKEDVFDVVAYVHDNPDKFGIDPKRMAIGGHSAGGNISTVMCMMAKEKGDFQFKCAIMDYPVCDMNTDAHEKPTPEGCLPPDLAAVFDMCYRDPADGKNPHLSPIFATADELAGLPPHVILTAEGDSLCFEAEEHAKHLMAAGVEVTGRRFMKVGHGFSLERFGLGNLGTPEELAATREAAQRMMIDGIKRYL